MKLNHGAYILARFSTDNQEVDSIDVQVQKCREWCAREHLPVLDVFADEATSGMKDTRPEYARMMRQLAEGGADTVVIYDQSRMFRKLTAWFQFREQVACYGVRVVAVTQPIIGGDLRDPMTFLSEGSMALMNQMWVLQTRQKVIAKMRYMAEQGKHTGGKPPLGYDVKDERLVVNEEEADTVRIIFGDYAAGASYIDIIRKLNDLGRLTKAGKPFGKNSLHEILKNEKYIGTLVYGKVEQRPDGQRNSHAVSDSVIRIENKIPAIIDRVTWDAVQTKMKANQKEKAGRPAKRDYPLKGKVFCRECKSAMSLESSRGYYYYVCGKQRRTCDCDGSRIKVDLLEGLVYDAVKKIVSNPKNVDYLIEILRTQRGTVLETAVQRMRELTARRAEVTKQIDAGTNAVLAGMLSDTLMDKIHALEAEQNQIDKEMLRLKTSVDGGTIPEDKIRLMMNSGDMAMLLSLVVRVEVGKDRIFVWTLLDADPNGRFDFSDDVDVGAVEIPGDQLYDNRGCTLCGANCGMCV